MRDVFWKAGIITLLVIIFGLFVGYWFDEKHVSSMKAELEKLDVEYNDALLQTFYINTFKNSSNFCSTYLNKTLELSEITHQKGMKLEQYEKINRFSPNLILEKKKYALLLLRLWFNFIQLKEICNVNYTTIAYFYKHNAENVISKTQQRVQSAVLWELKNKCGRDKILIFALPIDLNMTTINLLVHQYNIRETPTTLIDERWVFEGVKTYDELINYTVCGSNERK